MFLTDNIMRAVYQVSARTDDVQRAESALRAAVATHAIAIRELDAAQTIFIDLIEQAKATAPEGSKWRLQTQTKAPEDRPAEARSIRFTMPPENLVTLAAPVEIVTQTLAGTPRTDGMSKAKAAAEEVVEAFREVRAMAEAEAMRTWQDRAMASRSDDPPQAERDPDDDVPF